MSVVVGVPALNCWEYTKRTLDSINIKDVVLVDQGSKPEVLEQERGYTAQRGFSLIENGKNIGCSAAWNQIIEWGLPRFQYVLVGNNDIVLRFDTIRNLLAFWQARPHPNIVSLGSFPLECRSGHTVESLQTFSSKDPFTYGFSGPFFLFTQETRDKAGLFDTFYSQGNGIYFEDNDYHWTLLEKGLLSVLVHSAPVLHNGSRTLYNALDRKKTEKIYQRNEAYFRKKHNTDTTDWTKQYEVVDGVVKRK